MSQARQVNKPAYPKQPRGSLFGTNWACRIISGREVPQGPARDAPIPKHLWVLLQEPGEKKVRVHPTRTYLFPPSSLRCVDNIHLQPCALFPSHLGVTRAASPWAFIFESSTTQARGGRDLLIGNNEMLRDLRIYSISDMRALM